MLCTYRNKIVAAVNKLRPWYFMLGVELDSKHEHLDMIFGARLLQKKFTIIVVYISHILQLPRQQFAE